MKDRAQARSHRKGNRQAVRRRAGRSRERPARSRRTTRSHRQSRPQPWRRKARRRDSPPRFRWHWRSCRHPATSAACPINGRFDQQRYQYALWRPNPLRSFKLSPEEVHTELARKYFGWIGPASVADFQTFAGLGVKAAKAALDPLQLEAIEVGPGDQRFFLPGDRAKFEAFKPAKEPRYSLLGSIDSLLRPPGRGPADIVR